MLSVLGQDGTTLRTCDTEVLNLISSFAACSKIRLKAVDLSNAYFQGEKMDRVLLSRPPRGGWPREPDDRRRLAANVPICGTADSGRKFHNKFCHVAVSVGLRECKHARSSCVYEVDGDIQVLMGAHVDDLLGAVKSGYRVHCG